MVGDSARFVVVCPRPRETPTDLFDYYVGPSPYSRRTLPETRYSLYSVLSLFEKRDYFDEVTSHQGLQNVKTYSNTSRINHAVESKRRGGKDGVEGKGE